MIYEVYPPKVTFHSISLTNQDLIQLLNGGHEAGKIKAELKEIVSKHNIPYNADITFNIPGGGDYSNTLLALEDTSDKLIHIKWSETHD